MGKREQDFKKENDPRLNEYQQLAEWVRNEFTPIKIADFRPQTLDGSKIQFNMPKQVSEKIDEGLKTVR
jgi:hypothetical protein